MPPRAEPGDREKIEPVLGSAHRTALRTLCSTLDEPRGQTERKPRLLRALPTAAASWSFTSCRGEERGRPRHEVIKSLSRAYEPALGCCRRVWEKIYGSFLEKRMRVGGQFGGSLVSQPEQKVSSSAPALR